jgi:hypothetical protein
MMEPRAIIKAARGIKNLKACTPCEFLALEEWLIQAVSWDLYNSKESAPTSFIDYMLEDEDLTEFQASVLTAVLEFSYSLHELCRFRASVIAASILTVAGGYAMGRDRRIFCWKTPLSIESGMEWQHHRQACTTILEHAFLQATAQVQSSRIRVAPVHAADMYPKPTQSLPSLAPSRCGDALCSPSCRTPPRLSAIEPACDAY